MKKEPKKLMKELESNPSILSDLSFDHTQGREVHFFSTIVKTEPQYYPYFPKHARINKSIVKIFVQDQKNSSFIKDENTFFVLFNAVKSELSVQKEFVYNLTDELKNSKTIFNWLVNKNGDFLRYASKDLKNDKKIVLRAVKRSMESYEFASKELRADLDVANLFLSDKKHFHYFGSRLIKFMPESLTSDKNILIKMYKTGEHDLNHIRKFITNEMKDDKEFMILVLKSNDFFNQISDRLKKDKDVIIAALSHDYKHINSIDMENFKNDEDFIFKVLKHHSKIITRVSKKLIENEKFIEQAYKINAKIYKFLRPDEGMLLKIAKWNPKICHHVNESQIEKYRQMCKNRDFVMACTLNYRHDGYVPLWSMDEALKSDKEIILAGIKHSSDYFYGMPHEYKQDEKFNKKCVEINAHWFKWYKQTPMENIENDREIVLKAIKQKPKVIKYVKESMKNDKEIAMEAVKRSRAAYKLLLLDLKSDIEIQWQTKRYFKQIKKIQVFDITFSFQ
eukprot:gene10731-3351_t